MDKLLHSLDGKSTSIFSLAAGLLIIYAIGAGINTFTEASIGLVIKEIFQAAGYGMAFIGGLSLYTSLSDDRKLLARVGAVLTALGSIGAAVLLVGYTLEPLGVIPQVPSWVDAFGIGVPLGQIGLLLFGIAALRSDRYPTPMGLALMGPLLAFVVFFIGAGIIGAENAPYWAPFATVSLQTAAHLLLALAFLNEASSVAEQPAESSVQATA